MSSPIISINKMSFPWQTQDPFLFCAHHRDEYPKGNADMGVEPSEYAGRNMGSDFTLKDGYRMYHGSKVPGFPYHPHRGFETITINKEGFVDHSDSLGASGRFGAGDVQWMTAGKGVLHSEMFPLLEEEKDNPLEIFQIWLNLPKANKFVEPHFKMLWNDMIPTITEEDRNGNKTIVDIIAGTYNNTNAPAPTPDSWAADPSHGISVMTVKMEANAQWTLAATDKNVKRSLYFYRGDKLTIESHNISEYNMFEADPRQDLNIINGNANGFILVLEGQPINEPVVQHGPFVMNTAEEIQDAFAEYRRTQFGGWPWPMQEQVHDRQAGRFAIHADGVKEEK